MQNKHNHRLLSLGIDQTWQSTVEDEQEDSKSEHLQPLDDERSDGEVRLVDREEEREEGVEYEEREDNEEQWEEDEDKGIESAEEEQSVGKDTMGDLGAVAAPPAEQAE